MLAAMELADEVCTLDQPTWEERLTASDAIVLVAGRVEGRHALGVPKDLPVRLLERADVDFVVAEADGSRMRPVK